MSLPAAASDARPVGGGDINEAWHVDLDGRDAFVKTRPGAGDGEYALEAEGLRWLDRRSRRRACMVICGTATCTLTARGDHG